MYVVGEMNFGNGWVNVPHPINWREAIKLSMVFTDAEPSNTMNGSGFTWVNDAEDNTATLIKNYIKAGISGGQGIGEGIGYRLYIPDLPNNLVLFDGILNLPTIIEECDKVTLNLKYINAIDWFHTMMESIMYYSLTQEGLAASSTPPPAGFNAYIGPPNSGAKYSYKITPYVVTQRDDIQMAVTLILENISMFGHIKTAWANTLEALKTALACFTTDPPGDVSSAIIAILGLVGQLLWDGILLLAIIGNIETLVNQFGLLLKYKYCMTVPDIMHASFDYINDYMGTKSQAPVNFKSSIFDQWPYSNCTIMPEKFYKENVSDVNFGIITGLKSGGIATRGSEVNGGSLPPYNPGGPRTNAYGYPDWNGKEVLNKLYKVFNAKCFMIGQQVRFEEKHYFIPSNYTIPNVDRVKYSLNEPDPHDYNWDELRWNYGIRYQTDGTDERTRIVYTGTSCNVCTQPKFVKNAQWVTPSPGEVVMLDFALAKRKENLNFIELVVNDILQYVGGAFNVLGGILNAITGTINKIAKLAGVKLNIPKIPKMPTSLNGLIGALELSADTFSIPKIFIGTQVGALWYIDPNNGANNNGVWNNPNTPASTPHRGEGHMSAFAMLNLNHCKNLPLYTPVDYKGNKLPQVNNQWWRYKNKRFPMCKQDYKTILGTNMFYAPDGTQAKFDKLTYVIPHDMGEDVLYRKNKIYSTNFKTTLTVDGN